MYISQFGVWCVLLLLGNTLTALPAANATIRSNVKFVVDRTATCGEFPKGIFDPADTNRDTRIAQSMAEFLCRVDIPPLASLQGTQGRSTYRLFVHSLPVGTTTLIRVEEVGRDHTTYVLKQFKHGDVLISTRKGLLTSEQREKLSSALRSTNFWTLSPALPAQNPAPLDGSLIMFEGLDDHQNHTIIRRNPRAGDPIIEIRNMLYECADHVSP